MNPLLSLHLVLQIANPTSLGTPTPLGAPHASPGAQVWQDPPSLSVRRADPFASVPRELVLAHGVAGRLTLSPTGSQGPSPAPAFDALSATTQYDRLKADRMAGLAGVGGGVVLTVTQF